MDYGTASNLSQRAHLGRLVALVGNERIANVIYDSNRQQYVITPWQDSKNDRLLFPGRQPLLAKTQEHGAIVPALMIESDIKQGPYIHQRRNGSSQDDSWINVTENLQPEELVQVLRDWNEWDEDLTEVFAVRLQSSQKYLIKSYLQQRPCPTVKDDFITWEQSIMEGNMHPLHKCRMHIANKGDRHSKTNQEELKTMYHFETPNIVFFAVKRSCLEIYGDLEGELRPLLEAAGIDSSQIDPETEIIVPVHENQIEQLLDARQAKGNLRLLPGYSVPALAQASTRTVTVPSVPGLEVKMAISMIIGDTLRQVEPEKADLAVALCKGGMIDPEHVSGMDVPTLEIIPEVAGAVGFDRHLGVLLRHSSPPNDDICYAMAGALGEPVSAGSVERVAESVFELHTLKARQDFFRQYTRLFLQTFLPPLFNNSLLFHAHGQNSLLKISRSTKELLGFACRDIGDTRFNISIYESTTGIKVADSMKWRDLPVVRLLETAHRFFLTVHLIPFMVQLRLDHRQVKPEDGPDGITILVQEIDAILREYEVAVESMPAIGSEVTRNLVKQARHIWLGQKEFPFQAIVSQGMRADWKARIAHDPSSRIVMPNLLAQQVKA